MRKLKEFIELIKGSIEIIKTVAIAVFVVASFLGYRSCDKFKERYQETQTILTETSNNFKNQLGQSASESHVIRMRYENLEKAFNQVSSEKTEYEKKMSKYYQEIELYKRKNKDLEFYISNHLEVKDTLFVPMPADCYQQINPIKTKHLELKFEYFNDSLVKIPYKYSTDISTLITLYPKKKANGKKHFPNWGFIWGWEKYSITTVEDKNATVNNNISIEFSR